MGILLAAEDIVDIAVALETRGELFYREAARHSQEPESRALFDYLANEERRHKAFFEQLTPGILTTEVAPAAWEEAAAYIEDTVGRAFFQPDAPIQKVAVAATQSERIQQAIQFEQQTILFFYTFRDLMRPEHRDLLDQVIAEERRHVRRLSAMLADE